MDFRETCRRVSIFVKSKKTSSHEELRTFMIYLLLEHVKFVPRHRDSKSVVKVRRQSTCRVKRGNSHANAGILVLSFHFTRTNDTSARHKIPRILWNPKVHSQWHDTFRYSEAVESSPRNLLLCFKNPL
jgi:hypothetical protein